jgi:omega-6 fatty acid desaturase (delta-12 desaturase)
MLDAAESPVVNDVVVDGEEHAPSDAMADLVRKTMVYSREDRAQTWRLLTVSLLVYGIGLGLAIFAPWPLAIAGSVLSGLTLVRLFIFVHDYLHGAIFRRSTLGKVVMYAVALITLNPPSVWRETHNYHHRNNAKMLGAAIGSYPVVTTRMWKVLTPSQRFWYAFARSPLTILFGYATIFIAGMCMAAFIRNPKEHWQGPAALAYHFGLAALLSAAFGWHAGLLAVIVPGIISNTLGAYLFYAQHNFPSIWLADRTQWDYHQAALKSSSMFEMSALMHWFTGNIGYHHVHHLNHNIPFYRLPEAMAAIPELQVPGRTSWHPRDIAACLRLKLWDPEKQAMVGWTS